MICDSCKSDRVLKTYCKAKDLIVLEYKNKIVYKDMLDCCIIEDENIELDLCLQCGKIQGNFPVNDPKL
jgi:hypothetical protein